MNTKRVLRLTGAEPTTKGTITNSVGALDIASSVSEPVRLQGNDGAGAVLLAAASSPLR